MMVTVLDMNSNILSGEVDARAVAAVNEDLDRSYQFRDNEGLPKELDPQKLRHIDITNVLLGTDELIIYHGLDKIPLGYRVYPKSGVLWHETRDKDQTSIYLAAAAALTVDITVEG